MRYERMSSESNPGKEAQQKGCRASNSQVRPLALGLNAQVGTSFLEGHFKRPAHDEPLQDLAGGGSWVSAQGRQGFKFAKWVTDKDPAEWDRQLAIVKPDRSLRDELNRPFDASI